MGVLLVQGLSQVLGTSYYRPPCRTSAPATAPRTQVGRMPMMAVGMTRMGCRTHHLALPVLMHSVRHRPFLVLSRMSSRRLNVLVLVLSPLARPRYPLVRAGRVHDMLLLEVRMRATRGHILQEVVMHVIGIILIGRWLFAGWRVTRMWGKVLDAGLRFRRDIHHVTLGLYFSQ